MHFWDEVTESSSTLGEGDRVIGDLRPCTWVMIGESASSWRKSGSISGTLENMSSGNILRFRTGSCTDALGKIIQELDSVWVGV